MRITKRIPPLDRWTVKQVWFGTLLWFIFVIILVWVQI